MNENNKIYITIGYGDSKSDQKDSKSNGKDEDSKLSSYLQHKTLDFIKSKTIQAVNKSVNRIGSMKGDYIAMNETQYAIQDAKNILSFATAIYAGAKIGGVYGAIAGGVFAFASTTVDSIQDMIDYKSAYNIQQREIGLIQQRSGLNSALNESRTGS